MQRKIRSLLLLGVLLSLLSAACSPVAYQVKVTVNAGGVGAAAAGGDILDALADDVRFKTLTSLIESTDLATALKDGGPYTLFAPSDAAFARLPKGMLDLLTSDRALLLDVLLNHVVQGEHTIADLADQAGAPTALEWGMVSVAAADPEVFVEGARVIQADIPAANGLIHVIDAVNLAPVPLTQRLRQSGKYKILLQAIEAANMTSQLDKPSHDYTFFAPSDTAFKRVPSQTLRSWMNNPKTLQNILSYHLTPVRANPTSLTKVTELDTLYGDSKLHITTSGKAPSNIKLKVNGVSSYLVGSVSGTRGMLYYVDKVLWPPK